MSAPTTLPAIPIVAGGSVFNRQDDGTFRSGDGRYVIEKQTVTFLSGGEVTNWAVWDLDREEWAHPEIGYASLFEAVAAFNKFNQTRGRLSHEEA